MSSALSPLRTVLLVDDDKVTNLVHGRLVERTGLVGAVDIATDGVAALEYLETRKDQNLPMPELIFLDIHMPRMGGFEFLDEYASKSAYFRSDETMIILLSTAVLYRDQDWAEANQIVHDFVCKPINIQDIKGFVEQYQERAT